MSHVCASPEKAVEGPHVVGSTILGCGAQQPFCGAFMWWIFWEPAGHIVGIWPLFSGSVVSEVHLGCWVPPGKLVRSGWSRGSEVGAQAWGPGSSLGKSCA